MLSSSRRAATEGGQQSDLVLAPCTHKRTMYTYERLLKTLTCVTRLGIDNRPEGGVSPLSRAGGSEISERERGGSRTIGPTTTCAILPLLLPALVVGMIYTTKGRAFSWSLDIHCKVAKQGLVGGLPAPERRKLKSRAERGPESFKFPPGDSAESVIMSLIGCAPRLITVQQSCNVRYILQLH